MLRTVLLLDGSEAMNSSSDYLPSYLLALRRPVMQFISEYLDSTPLASLGAVVMRDSISRRLCSCTANASEIVEKLERDYFLYGGSGATSLENGLRMTLSELVDLQKLVEKRSSADASSSASRRRQPQAVRLHVLLVTASVTLIDPTDVFRVINTFRKFNIQIDVITFHGAVHVYDMCARQTGGQLYCPLRFDHLLRILHQLAVNGGYKEDVDHGGHCPRLGYTLRLAQNGVGAAAEYGEKSRASRKSSPQGNNHHGAEEGDQAAMVPIGFPILLERPLKGVTSSPSTDTYLACPQCHFIQTAIPSTCSLCKLLLCNVGMIFSTFVAHNHLVPPFRRLHEQQQLLSSEAAGSSVETLPSKTAVVLDEKASNEEEEEAKEGGMERKVVGVRGSILCHLCAEVVGQSGGEGWMCEACSSVRCDTCHVFVMETLGLCPCCVALQ
ncbi:unnamed protein product [Phytomonas sp. EM1]|nr:unnamed protein product [Phytomonas sp. EM1]|eukprot:CCW62602.1 unnamed protein product [Phytomonas sp. isolate EM1]